MPAKRSPRSAPSTAKYIDTPQLRDRYGGVSHMWVERRLQNDPTFPRPIYIGRLRYFEVEKLAAWERAVATKSRAA